jgi:hypothetical protein
MARPRLFDPKYLSWLAKQPCCCGCGRPAPSEAAHVKINWFCMAKKPDDRFAVPLNAWCHQLAPDAQHKNETAFWERRGLDPYKIAARFYAEFGGDGGKPRRKRTVIKPRLPPEQRQKIRSRGFPKKQRRKISA